MSITHALSNALSGMTVASRMAEVVSSNLSNVLTDGYGRRTLDISPGTGLGSVTRHIDRGVLADRRLADASLGGFETLVSTMGQVADAIGRVGEDGSMSSRIVAVESALIDAAAEPSSQVRLTALGDRLDDLAQALNSASSEVQGARVDADSSIANQVDKLNTSLSQVERLNKDIAYALNTGGDSSGLMDQRQRVIDTIAEIVPIREMDRSNGQVALITPEGATLIDGRAKEFGFVHNGVITPDMTVDSGGLSGLTLDGVTIADDGIGKLAGGSLGASFQARDVELVTAQSGLDNLAADLISRFQDSTVDPTLSAGDAGLLTDNGTAFDVANIEGLAGRISLNALVDPKQGGTLTNLRDGLNAASPGPSGNASLLQSLSAALSEPRTTATDPIQQSAAGRAATLETQIGNQRLEFESELSFANARWSSLKEAEAARGVDTDQEMQMLLRVEQAYAANARVIQTAESMMQRLMEL